MTAGTLADTYVAALQHDLAEIPDGATLLGVVRRPTPWFSAAVDDNRPALGPPESLLDDVRDRIEDLEVAGLCAEEAHNAAWREVDFADRYREHLAGGDAAREVATLRDRLADGEDLALVCYENTDQKRCHRTLLRDHLEREGW